MAQAKDVLDLTNSVVRRAWTVWAVMFVSLVVYLIACLALVDRLKVFVIQDFPLVWVRNILLVVSAIVFVMAGNIRKFQLHGKAIAERVKKTGKAAIDEDSVIMKYMSVMVISLALAEVVAIFGLLIFLLSTDFTSLYAFLAFSGLTMLIYCPKSSEVKTIVAKMIK